MRWCVGALLVTTTFACEALVGITDKSVASEAGGIDGGVGLSKDGSIDGSDLSAPCIQQPQPFVFCDDFDSVTSVADTWSWQTVTPAQSGSVALETTEFTSRPRSARVVAQPVTGEVQLGLMRDLGAATAFRVAFDLRIEADSLAGAPEVALVQTYAGNGITLNYVVGPGIAGELQVYDQAATPAALIDGVPLSTLPPLRTWARVVLAYDSTTGAAASQDGRTVAQSARAARPGSLGMSGFILGAAFVLPPGSTSLTSEFDNVVVRAP
jgi:hypothetical protein